MKNFKVYITPGHFDERPLLGEALVDAQLINQDQLTVALKQQHQFPELRLGEIMTQWGWLSEKTVTFFAQRWPFIVEAEKNRPIGYFFQQAGLLNEQDIDRILKEHKRLGLKFGEVGVLQGCIKRATLDFFLKFLLPKKGSDSQWDIYFKTTATKGDTLTTKETLIINSDQPRKSLKSNKVDDDPSDEDTLDLAMVDSDDITWIG